MMYLLLLLQQLIGSSTHLIAKSATGALHPTLVVLVRGLFTASAFGAWWYVRRSSMKPVRRADLPLILLLGLVNIPINQLLFIWGVKYTTAPNAALAYALTPVFVVVILALRGQSTNRWRWLGVGIALLGAAIVLSERGLSFAPEYMLGNVMVLLASASWALYTVMGKPLIATYGSVQASALSFFSGVALYAVVWMLLPIPTDIGPLVTGPEVGRLWFQLFYLGVITSAIGYGLWYYALTKLETSSVAVFNNLQPVLTTLLAFLVFGTEPTLTFVIGGAVALAGVVVTQRV